MFTVVLVFTLLTTYVMATLPPYIHPCGYKDSNYNQCLKNSIDSMKDKICTGMPELNMPANEPIVIEKLVIYDTANAKLNLRDAKVYGVCDFDINSIHSDPDKFHYELDANIKNVHVNSKYDFDIRLLTHITHEGIVQVTLNNPGVKVGIDFKMVTKKGKIYGYTSKIDLKFTINNFNYKFVDEKEELHDLHNVLNDIIHKNQENILNKIKPAIEQEVSKKMISILNKVISTRFEELFPEHI